MLRHFAPLDRLLAPPVVESSLADVYPRWIEGCVPGEPSAPPASWMFSVAQHVFDCLVRAIGKSSRLGAAYPNKTNISEPPWSTFHEMPARWTEGIFYGIVSAYLVEKKYIGGFNQDEDMLHFPVHDHTTSACWKVYVIPKSWGKMLGMAIPSNLFLMPVTNAISCIMSERMLRDEQAACRRAWSVGDLQVT